MAGGGVAGDGANMSAAVGSTQAPYPAAGSDNLAEGTSGDVTTVSAALRHLQASARAAAGAVPGTGALPTAPQQRLPHLAAAAGGTAPAASSMSGMRGSATHAPQTAPVRPVPPVPGGDELAELRAAMQQSTAAQHAALASEQKAAEEAEAQEQARRMQTEQFAAQAAQTVAAEQQRLQAAQTAAAAAEQQRLQAAQTAAAAAEQQRLQEAQTAAAAVPLQRLQAEQRAARQVKEAQAAQMHARAKSDAAEASAAAHMHAAHVRRMSTPEAEAVPSQPSRGSTAAADGGQEAFGFIPLEPVSGATSVCLMVRHIFHVASVTGRFPVVGDLIKSIPSTWHGMFSRMTLPPLLHVDSPLYAVCMVHRGRYGSMHTPARRCDNM